MLCFTDTALIMRRTKLRGFTLIELLVSIAIGLVILLAIGVAYTSTSNMSRQREALSELQLPAVMALNMIKRDISQAGYVDMLDSIPNVPFGKALQPVDDDKTNHFVRSTLNGLRVTAPIQSIFPLALPVFACDGQMSSSPLSLLSTSSVLPDCVDPAATSLRHSIQIVQQGIPGSINPTRALRPTATGTIDGRDCLQQDAATGSSVLGRQFIVNRYFIQASASDGVSELYCEGSGNTTPQPLVRGVEEFTVRFQLASVAQTTTTVTGSGSSIVTSTSTVKVASGASSGQFFNATDVAGSELSWAGVTGVEVCLVVASAPNGLGVSADAVDAQPTRPTCARTASGSFAADVVRSSGDKRLWRRFTAYVAVRNAIFTTSAK
jgi:type IV pilus assembly protein PilW